MAVQMNVGLEKLREASISVDELRKDLAEKEKDIIIASAKAEEVPTTSFLSFLLQNYFCTPKNIKLRKDLVYHGYTFVTVIFSLI